MLQVRCGYRGAKLRVLMPPLRKGRCRTDEGRLTEGLPLSREITLGTTTPQSICASQLPLRTETAFQAVPVFRMAYFAQKPHRGFCSKTLMLQVRFAHPTGNFAPKRPFGTFRCYGRLISTKSTQYSLLQNARPSGSLREPYGYRGAKLRVLMPPLCKGRCRTDEGRLTEGFPLSQNLPPERREARRRRASRQECGLRPAKGRGAHSCPPKPLVGRKTHTTRTRRRT